jgi:protein ImuB
VVAEVQRVGYEARVAIADTVGAAWAGAKERTKDEGQRTKDNERSVSSFVLRPSSLAPPSSFDLSLLRLPPETLDLLGQLGITQLEQLLALPRESLRARFGERLLLRVDQFLGTAQETIVAHRPPPEFVAEWVLEYPAERREAIEQLVQQLVQRVSRDLAVRREGAVQLVCRLDCSHLAPRDEPVEQIPLVAQGLVSRSETATYGPLLLEVGLFRPSAEPEHLWDLVRMQLEQATLSGPVGRITLAARLTAPLENRQGELFAGGEHETERQLALFIDRCSSRLGADAVLRAELTADPLPERAVRYVRSTKDEGRRTKGKRQRTTPTSFVLRPSSFVLSARPLFLHNPPLPLDALSVAPDGPPVSFALAGQRHSVVANWGPERIETGWWRGRSVRRDYWRVEATSGRRFWLFRSLDSGKWHLHGEF